MGFRILMLFGALGRRLQQGDTTILCKHGGMHTISLRSKIIMSQGQTKR